MLTETLVVTHINEKIRLDRYIKKLYPLITHGFLESLLRKSKIKVNRCKYKASQRLNENDRIDFYVDLSEFENKNNTETKSFSINIITLAKKIVSSYCLYQDDDILIINKPSGISTQGGNRINISIDHALQYMNSLDDKNQFRITHRLDKETSGILLIAKNYKYASIITEMFRNKVINKEYLAVLNGIPKNNSGVVKSNLRKIKTSDGFFVKNVSCDEEFEYKFEKDKNDEEKRNQINKDELAITEYKIVKYDKEKNISLCLFKPITGKMHQLRVHSQLLECSIVGDSKYSLTNYISIKTENCKLMLHAGKISFDYKGEKIKIESEIPKYFLLK